MFPTTPAAQALPLVPPPPPRPKSRKLWVVVTAAILSCSVLAAIFVGALLYFVDKVLRSSDLYRMALADAHASPCVVARLGEPIVSKGMPSGNIDEHNGDGSADLTIPIQGSHGKGSLHAAAARDARVWTITGLTFDPKDGPPIQLLPAPSGCP